MLLDSNMFTRLCGASLVLLLLLQTVGGAPTGAAGDPNAAAAKEAARKGRRQSVRALTSTPAPEFEDVPYFWMCPEVTCPPISDTCQTAEFMVFTYEYRLPRRGSGRGEATVTVRCESCRYCLDRPTAPTRFRRALEASAVGSEPQSPEAESQTADKCQSLVASTCPTLPANCRDARLTNVSIGDEQCVSQCPACYDDVFIADWTSTGTEN